jgi:diguanylate cyclase (GGDEF)-like protein
MPPSFSPDFSTAYGMTAIAGGAISWIIWALGRQYWHKGISYAIASTLLFCLTFPFLALQSRFGSPSFDFMARLLACSAMVAFALALQRFRQSTDWRRDAATALLPIGTALALAAYYLPAQLPSFQRLMIVVILAQAIHVLILLVRMRPHTPGSGWVMVSFAVCALIIVLGPLMFITGRPSPTFAQETTPGVVFLLWLACLIQFLILMTTPVGFLMMQRDREAALARDDVRLDALTQLLTRDQLQRRVEQIIESANDEQRPLSLMMVDIDHFKRFNDTHGHLAGDQILQMVARTLRQHSRSNDVIARFGGEEFVLLLPGAQTNEAHGFAQRLCDAVRYTPYVLSNGSTQHVTLSVGVHTRTPDSGLTWHALVRAADDAMNRAKQAGRDRAIATTA